jgi:hypothetical protein
MMKKTILIITVCSLLVSLSGCGYQQPAGHWQSIDATSLVFSGVEIDSGVKDKAYPDVCVEAQEEINAAIKQKLPAKIKPLTFNAIKAGPAAGSAGQQEGNARLDMEITTCELDSDQAGGTFTFYLTLTVQVSLKVADRTVMAYTMDTYEQAVSSTPSPDFEFTFAEPKVRTLMLFEAGRVWIPDGAS